MHNFFDKSAQDIKTQHCKTRITQSIKFSPFINDLPLLEILNDKKTITQKQYDKL